MKAILEFNLPEESKDHLIASNAMAWALIVWDMDQYLRNLLKYGHEFKSIDDALEKTRAALYDFLVEKNLTLDSIE